MFDRWQLISVIYNTDDKINLVEKSNKSTHLLEPCKVKCVVKYVQFIVLGVDQQIMRRK